MYNSILIANFFVKKAIDEKVEMTPMKVIKLTYIAHGWYLALKGSPLIDENPEAWMYGPVIPRVYRVFKHFGDSQITHIEQEHRHQPDATDLSLINPEDDKFLNLIWERYKTYSGIELSAITHKEGTPWDIVWNKGFGSKISNTQIPDTIIRDHYLNLFQKRSGV